MATSLGLGRKREALRDQADEGVDLVAGDEGADRRQGADHLDVAGSRPISSSASRSAVASSSSAGIVPAPAGKRDLAGVAAEVGAALGEDQAGLLGVAVDRHQHGGVGRARARCIAGRLPGDRAGRCAAVGHRTR